MGATFVKSLTSWKPRNSEKLKVARKRLKSDFWGLPQSNPKSYFSGYFLGLLWGDPESHFLVTFELLLIFRTMLLLSENAVGGWKREGGGKPNEWHPSQKGVLDPPLVRYAFHSPQVSVLCFSCTRIHGRAEQKLFWRGPKIFGRALSLARFPPPIRLAPPHGTAQYLW